LPVLLLDEPTEGLDAAARARVLEALDRVRHERSLIVVTHRPEVAARADRVIELG
jgi:ABC-type bacteriocin/lantibiotic exporter with double-glycine peptidase domain